MRKEHELRLLEVIQDLIRTGDPLTPEGNSNQQWAEFDAALIAAEQALHDLGGMEQ